MKAALRDAQWFDHPDVHSVKQYHVAIETGQRVRLSGAPPIYVAACNRETRPLAEFTAVPLGDVPVGLRCQSNGCKQRWP